MSPLEILEEMFLLNCSYLQNTSKYHTHQPANNDTENNMILSQLLCEGVSSSSVNAGLSQYTCILWLFSPAQEEVRRCCPLQPAAALILRIFLLLFDGHPLGIFYGQKQYCRLKNVRLIGTGEGESCLPLASCRSKEYCVSCTSLLGATPFIWSRSSFSLM